MNVVSLFAGIGGLELGLERSGMSIVGQVEINPYCRSVLARHWPEVPRHDDVRTAPAWWLEHARPPVDVIAGGFPCQPFSKAGKQLGIADERWGWPWMFDVIRAIRPRYVVMENVAALLRDADAFGWVLRDLHQLGFDAEWSVLSACALGAPHTRERLFVVAYPHRIDGRTRLGSDVGEQGRPVPPGDRGPSPWADPINGVATAARIGRVADGLPPGVDAHRVTAVGNAVVPDVAELIGAAVIELERTT